MRRAATAESTVALPVIRMNSARCVGSSSGRRYESAPIRRIRSTSTTSGGVVASARTRVGQRSRRDRCKSFVLDQLRQGGKTVRIVVDYQGDGIYV